MPDNDDNNVVDIRNLLARQAAAKSKDGTEDQLALDFSFRHGDELRYCAAWGKWLHWDNARWKIETSLLVYTLARDVARDYMHALDRQKLGAAATVHAIIQLARADRRHAAVAEQWDRDPWLLNTPAGTVELPKGILREHRRDDYLTRITAAPAGGPCPLWQNFLLRVMAGDRALVDYLQRVVGYCLTGSTREHALFFCYGTGRNGKSVFIDTLATLFGDYATEAAMETFLTSTHDRHPAELAALRGARLVTAQEVQDGRRWDAVKVKALTGGNTITARFMRQDFFSYTPEFKLLLAGNHKPGLSGVDEAWRARFNLIPFRVTIPTAERDPRLKQKLQREWPGILQWAIAGCRAWAERGLDPPPAVTEATEAYFTDQDKIGRWIEECCALDPIYFETIARLYASWKVWCEAAGLRPGSEMRFGQDLEDRAFRRHREGGTGTRGFLGIALQP